MFVSLWYSKISSWPLCVFETSGGGGGKDVSATDQTCLAKVPPNYYYLARAYACATVISVPSPKVVSLSRIRRSSLCERLVNTNRLVPHNFMTYIRLLWTWRSFVGCVQSAFYFKLCNLCIILLTATACTLNVLFDFVLNNFHKYIHIYIPIMFWNTLSTRCLITVL